MLIFESQHHISLRHASRHLMPHLGKFEGQLTQPAEAVIEKVLAGVLAFG